MKRSIINVMTICFSIAAMAIGNSDGETRSATVRLDVSSSDVINIQAKYTDLTVEAWDKNEVVIEASIRYDGKMTDKIQAFLDQFEKLVEENVKLQNGELLINTGVDFPNRGVKKSFFGFIVEINIGDYDQAKLEYKIKTPPGNKYVINNSYRDVKMIGSFKNVELTQYSGDLEADFIDKSKLNLKYGSASFKGLGETEMEIYEQEIESGGINKLKLNTKYSDLEITEVGIFTATSYESDYTIGSIENLSGNFKYGEIEITQNIKVAKLTLYEENIEARKIESLTLENSKYSKIEVARMELINIIESYENEFTLGELGSLNSENSKYGKYKIDQLKGKFELKGYEDKIEIEGVSSSATMISIDGKYIDVGIGAENVPFKLLGKVKYGELDYNENKIEVRKYIKESDLLEVEFYSKGIIEKRLQINVAGYEINLRLE